jgi:hypothetical protein
MAKVQEDKDTSAKLLSKTSSVKSIDIKEADISANNQTA